MYTVESEDIIQMDESCKDLLIEAMKYHLMPEKRNQLQSIRTKERRSQAFRPMLFAVGKKNTTEISDTYMYVDTLTICRSVQSLCAHHFPNDDQYHICLD